MYFSEASCKECSYAVGHVPLERKCHVKGAVMSLDMSLLKWSVM